MSPYFACCAFVPADVPDHRLRQGVENRDVYKSGSLQYWRAPGVLVRRANRHWIPIDGSRKRDVTRAGAHVGSFRVLSLAGEFCLVRSWTDSRSALSNEQRRVVANHFVPHGSMFHPLCQSGQGRATYRNNTGFLTLPITVMIFSFLSRSLRFAPTNSDSRKPAE